LEKSLLRELEVFEIVKAEGQEIKKKVKMGR
jgi:hypothetical protein